MNRPTFVAAAFFLATASGAQSTESSLRRADSAWARSYAQGGQLGWTMVALHVGPAPSTSGG